MGLANLWRSARALRAVVRAANEAAAEGPQGPPGAREPKGPASQRGDFVSGLGNMLAQAVGPRLQVNSEVRGDPLRGSEPEVVDQTAWRQDVAAQAALLRARDTAFDAGLLEGFAVDVAATVSAIWLGTDPAAARMVMSDALWEPLAAVVTQNNAVAAKRAARGAKRGTEPSGRLSNPIQEGRPTAARLAGLKAGSWYHSALLTVHFTLREEWLAELRAAPSEVRAWISAEFNGADFAQWDEDWLFQRSAQPGGNPMIEPPACPACGAHTRIDEQGRCLHCQQPVPWLTTGWLATMIVSHHPLYARWPEVYAPGLADDPRTLPGSTR